MAETETARVLAKFGISDSAVKKKAKAAVAALLRAVEGTAALSEGVPSDVGPLLRELATSLAPEKSDYLPLLGARIADGRINSKKRLALALAFVASVSVPAEKIEEAELDMAAGVGVVVDSAEIRDCVESLCSENMERLKRERYKISLTFGEIKSRFPRLAFADRKHVLAEVECCMLRLLGPKTAEDTETARSVPRSGIATSLVPSAEDTIASPAAAFEARDLECAKNTPELLAEHVAITAGRLVTRFPPEPNGHLHLGHAKSMNINFKLAFHVAGAMIGDTIFRYDDTNPDTESMDSIESAAENVSWMGWAPSRTTFTSNYFDTLHSLAVRLIREGKAYVCHLTTEEMAERKERRKSGKDGFASPWRDRPIEENIREFEKMRTGHYEEGSAVLRLKMDWASANPNMWDIVAYRIKIRPHPRTGNTWCIYPSYDFAHCIVDSLEHIDLSLCTLEFETRRESYYWLLETLGMWRPRVWEFSRLHLAKNVLSKRKLRRLVDEGIVRGWDDPRLLTIDGLRRRGYSASDINLFCDDMGLTRSNNTIRRHKFEHHCRERLGKEAPRGFAVLRPIHVTLVNVSGDTCFEVSAPPFPWEPERGTPRTLVLSRDVYIEAEDFCEGDPPEGFRRLTVGGTVGLKYAGVITCTGMTKDSSGTIMIEAEYSHDRTSKPKANLHWLSARPGERPSKAEVRLYEDLFLVDEPGKHSTSFLADINPTSETVEHESMIEPSLKGHPAYAAFEFERLGYFVVDKNSTFESLVFNRIFPLRTSEVSKTAHLAGS